MLKPGGVFRAVVPDLKAAVDAYIENYANQNSPASEFMRSTMLGVEHRGSGPRSVLMKLFGNSKHLWMWDYPSFRYELQQAGFRDIRPCRFGDATEKQFALVEEEGRFYGAAAIECYK